MNERELNKVLGGEESCLGKGSISIFLVKFNWKSYQTAGRPRVTGAGWEPRRLNYRSMVVGNKEQPVRPVRAKLAGIFGGKL